jgi:hypothetical protein
MADDRQMKTETAPDTGSPSLFDGGALALDVFRSVRRTLEEIGDVDVRITSTQASFRRRRGFAYVWMPTAWIDAPGDVVVLSIALDHEVQSPRFAQVLEPAPGRWMHHLEIRTVDEVDDEVTGWLADAWTGAG